MELDESFVQFFSSPKGIRTPVASVKGRCPRPLDDGAMNVIGRSFELPHLVKLRVSLTLRQDGLTPFLSLALPDRHGEGEAGPLVGFRHHPDAAAVHFHDATADRQPDAESGGAMRCLRQTDPVQKDPLLLFGGDARPAVADAHLNPLAGAVKHRQGDVAAISGVFEGILKQVEQHLSHPPLISEHLG